jgi:hypothetical protein
MTLPPSKIDSGPGFPSQSIAILNLAVDAIISRYNENQSCSSIQTFVVNGNSEAHCRRSVARGDRIVEDRSRLVIALPDNSRWTTTWRSSPFAIVSFIQRELFLADVNGHIFWPLYLFPSIQQYNFRWRPCVRERDVFGRRERQAVRFHEALADHMSDLCVDMESLLSISLLLRRMVAKSVQWRRQFLFARNCTQSP